MSDRTIFVDASVFLGMHHGDELLRNHSLWFFRQQYAAVVKMNFEQVGICDAVIWQESREVQDLYYPFMDRLHTDMEIARAGYTFEEIEFTLNQAQLRHLRPEQALLAGQVLHSNGLLATHDADLKSLPCLAGHLWVFEPQNPLPPFPPELQALYETSRVFVYGAEQGGRA